MTYPHKHATIFLDLDSVIERVKANKVVFEEKLKEVSKSYPHLYYQDQYSKLKDAITDLESAYDKLVQVDWVN